MKFIRTANTRDKYLIGHSYDNYPISYYCINEWLAAITLFPNYYIETPINDNYSIFDVNKYKDAIQKFTCQKHPDVLILRHKLAMAIPKDNTLMLKKYCDSNINIVKQFLSGKDKIVNSLLGIILKENKGIDPKSLLEEIVTYINENYSLEKL